MTREELIKVCKAARLTLPRLISTGARVKMLEAIADAIAAKKDEILAANAVDIPLARQSGISEVMIDRLRLTPERLDDIAGAVREVAALPDPLTPVSETTRPNGLRIVRQRVPFGVIAMIYESRPNVTVDAAAICLMSGNAVILRGGREAFNSNMALVGVISEAIAPFGTRDAVNLLTDTDRESVDALLSLRGYVDLLIPRGGAGLIRKVVDNAKVPVIETGTGNCHVYVHSSADLDMAQKIIIMQKPRVLRSATPPKPCSVTVIAPVFLPAAAGAARVRVELRVCPESMKYIPDATPATEEDYYTEFLDHVLAVKVVSDVYEAVGHITNTAQCTARQLAGDAGRRRSSCRRLTLPRFITTPRPLYRRRCVRNGSRNRNFDPEAACPRAVRP